MSFVRILVSATTGLLLLAAPAPSAHAQTTGALRCAFAKQRALVRKITAVLECQCEALRAGASVDPACTSAAARRFASDFAKAEARGRCALEGDADALEPVADQCSARIFVPLQGTCTEAGAACGGENAPCCTGLVCRGRVGSTPACGF